MILLFQILSVFVVLLLFHFLSKEAAGLLASSLFNIVALVSSYYFYKHLRFKSLGLYLWLLFFALFSFPIIALRIYYFDLSTSDISFAGFSFDWLHKSAERAYLLAFFAGLIDYLRIKKATK